ncbi:MAG: bifunctional N(6)-L-threonylcarbamoyladenine synthase/serine/threonine protein kinase [Candidatus Thermoplasmatota archaeon]|nr:bifunctional N(6)-L-threonylcarbamoyladenine synthase/serine/threonine protein kinase [Candidatus Thermoplasmatota archaeon]MEC8044956.1 bifunctional N(6)-L-threonylcarbamoyladenine synthase/serine/threonine protein kinase [Candidatus Thermoplasmatota archaeon]
MGVILGIESTAHTFSFGAVSSDGKDVLASHSSLYRPEEGGIHPREAADHHVESSRTLLERAILDWNVVKSDIDAVAFSQGPGLGPCLRVGGSVARSISMALNIPLIGVNHCVAHIEIGRRMTGCIDPVLLYVSGGNTQVIARASGRYRVLGETLDIGIGNMLDKFGRAIGIPFPGGPEIERKAQSYIQNCGSDHILDLPYAVHGTDMAFSGILGAAIAHAKKGEDHGLVCHSLQEISFASCVEVGERAMALTGKKEILLGGGVACNKRIRTMTQTMASERGGSAYWPDWRLCIDNGTMIAELGRRMLDAGINTRLSDSGIDPSLRTDMTPILWS